MRDFLPAGDAIGAFIIRVPMVQTKAEFLVAEAHVAQRFPALRRLKECRPCSGLLYLLAEMLKAIGRRLDGSISAASGAVTVHSFRVYGRRCRQQKLS